MAVMQMFPKTVEEFMEEYKMVDKDHVYSNGIEYVPIFRMKQWFEHISSVQPRKGKWIDYSDEGFVECPFCHSATNCDGNKDELHYCFSCGADMREGDAE